MQRDGLLWSRQLRPQSIRVLLAQCGRVCPVDLAACSDLFPPLNSALFNRIDTSVKGPSGVTWMPHKQALMIS
jgi:hypothetical protein